MRFQYALTVMQRFIATMINILEVASFGLKN